MPTQLEIVRARALQAANLVLLAFAAGGCAAMGEGVRKSADVVFGSPPPPPGTIETATALLPFPWNYLALALGSAVIGIWGKHYRDRLLNAPPPARTT